MNEEYERICNENESDNFTKKGAQTINDEAKRKKQQSLRVEKIDESVSAYFWDIYDTLQNEKSTEYQLLQQDM